VITGYPRKPPGTLRFYICSNKYLLEGSMFQTNVVEKYETRVLCSIYFFRESCGFRDNQTTRFLKALTERRRQNFAPCVFKFLNLDVAPWNEAYLLGPIQYLPSPFQQDDKCFYIWIHATTFLHKKTATHSLEDNCCKFHSRHISLLLVLIKY
jgi:hypothetical protein